MKLFILRIVLLLFGCAYFANALTITSEQTHFIKGVYKVSENMTFTQPVSFDEGAVLDIDPGVTVTFNNKFSAGKGQVFAGKGKIAGLDHLTPEWFGAKGDGTVDDTAAIQKALDSFSEKIFWHTDPTEKKNSVLLLRGTYLVTQLEVRKMYVHIIAENAWLVASPKGNYPYLIHVTRLFCSIDGSLSIEGSYNLGYESIIHVNARHFRGNNIRIWRAKLPFRFGNPIWADRPSPKKVELGDSENIFSNCSTLWCLRGIELYGAETIVLFNNSMIYSHPLFGDENDPRKKIWDQQKDVTLVRSIGSYIYFTGCKLCNFNPRCPIIEVQPLKTTNRQYYSKYGGAYLFNCHMEGGNYFAAVNPKKIRTQSWKGVPVNQQANSLTMIACGGYSSGNCIPIKTDALFTGTVIVQNCNFYTDLLGGPQYEFSVFAKLENPEAPIKIDNASLRNEVTPGLGAIVGGMPLFSNRLIFDGRKSAQKISSKDTRLIFTAPEKTADTPHFASCYNSQTGEFKVPAGGLDNVRVTAGIHFSNENWDSMSQISIMKNGKIAYAGNVLGSAGAVSTIFSRLEAEDVIAVNVRSRQTEDKLDGGDMNSFQITASKY